MKKIIKIGPIVSEENNRTDGRTHGRTDRQGSNYRPIFVPKIGQQGKILHVGEYLTNMSRKLLIGC